MPEEDGEEDKGLCYSVRPGGYDLREFVRIVEKNHCVESEQKPMTTNL